MKPKMGRPLLEFLEPLSTTLASSVVRPVRDLFLPAGGMINQAAERCPCNCSEAAATIVRGNESFVVEGELGSCVCPVREPAGAAGGLREPCVLSMFLTM